LCLSAADFSQFLPGAGLHGKPDRATDKGEILAEPRKKTRVSAGIRVANGSAVRVIFAAWVVLAILLLGLGRLTMAGHQEPAPKRLTAQR
jgi:hypothetical protein